MAKHEYEVFVNRDGNPFGSGTVVRVQADTEFEAQQIAKQRVPDGRNQQIASIKLIK